MLESKVIFMATLSEGNENDGDGLELAFGGLFSTQKS